MIESIKYFCKLEFIQSWNYEKTVLSNPSKIQQIDFTLFWEKTIRHEQS